MFFDFYVGSTSRFDAHAATRGYDLAIARALGGQDWTTQRLWGVWENEPERVAILGADFPTDAMAQRVAYALSVVTGNDAILVSRLATPHESEDSFTSTARYRVHTETRLKGNRTLWSVGEAEGFAYVPDVKGSHVAYLVNRDATIGKVTE